MESLKDKDRNIGQEVVGNFEATVRNITPNSSASVVSPEIGKEDWRPREGLKFFGAVRAFKQRFLKNYGMSSRSEYWHIQLPFFIVSFFLWVGIIWPSYSASITSSTLAELFSIFIFLVSLALWVPLFMAYLNLTVRRFHDIGLPGIFALVILIPRVGLLLAWLLCLLPSNPSRWKNSWKKPLDW